MNAPFPFVTIPDFREKSLELLKLEGVKTVGWAPIVSESRGRGQVVDQWSNFSSANQGWIEDYRVAQSSRFPPPQPISPTITKGTTNTEHAFAIPLWQMVPVTSITADMVNIDLVTNTTGDVSRAIIDIVSQQKDGLTSIDNGFVLSNQCPRCSIMASPVLESTADAMRQGEVKGLSYAMLSWDTLFVNKLPKEAGRMLVEVQNDCGVELSYSVKGPQTGLLGDGLLHDEHFQNLAVQLKSFASNSSDCAFSVTAYPTMSFKQMYVTDAPWVYSAGVICVFFFAASVFAFYDHSIHRKQEKLLQSAKKTSAIVAEIFPKNVRNQIIEEKEQRSSLHASRTSGLAPKSELKNLIGRDDKSNVESYKGKPIADLFPVSGHHQNLQIKCEFEKLR